MSTLSPEVDQRGDHGVGGDVIDGLVVGPALDAAQARSPVSVLAFAVDGAVVLAVVEDDDVGVIGVDDDALMRTPRSTVASGAFVISVTGSSSR